MNVMSMCCGCSSASSAGRSRRTPGGRVSSSPTPASDTGGCSVNPSHPTRNTARSPALFEEIVRRLTMKLEGIHHITAITGDAPGNVGFYAGTMGLRLVKKTVNQDDPTVYHLFYADEAGSPGADLTFFEYPGAGPGSPGAGMVHRIVWRVASEEALSFWEERLLAHGIESQRSPGRLEFNDPEGLGLALTVSAVADQPLIAEHPEVPAELAIQGFDGVRAHSFDPDRSRGLLQETLGFTPVAGASFEARGEQRGGFYVYDDAPRRGIPGAGTVHHVAWASPMDDHEAWQHRLVE